MLLNDFLTCTSSCQCHEIPIWILYCKTISCTVTKISLTRSDSVVVWACSFVETLDTQVKHIRVSRSQTHQLVDYFCCLPLRNCRRNVDIRYNGATDDWCAAEIPVQHDAPLLNIGFIVQRRNVWIWNSWKQCICSINSLTKLGQILLKWIT